MPATYEPIASQTLGSNAASVTFDNISAAWTDLRVITRSRTSSTGPTTLALVFNSNTSSIYSNTRIYGNGSSAASDRSTGNTYIEVCYVPPTSSSGFGTGFLDIMSYANTNVFTTVIGGWDSQENTSGNQYVLRSVQLWRSTSAITSLTFSMAAGNIVAGSTFALYGIKAA